MRVIRVCCISQLMNIAGWGVAAALGLSVVYGPYAANMGYHVVHISESMIYAGFARTAWGIAVAFLIISCALGQGGETIDMQFITLYLQ